METRTQLKSVIFTTDIFAVHMIFDIENSLWKSNFCTLRWACKARQRIPRCLWSGRMANFVSPSEKRGRRRCHFWPSWHYLQKFLVSVEHNHIWFFCIFERPIEKLVFVPDLGMLPAKKRSQVWKEFHPFFNEDMLTIVFLIKIIDRLIILH